VHFLKTLKEFTVVTPNTKTTGETPAATEMPALAQTIREQLLSTVKKGQQLSIDATQTWVKAVSVLPVHHLSDLPKIPGIPAMPAMETATTFTFDLADDLLTAQREFALKLTSAFVPAKTS
jgi:hypothetical protein